MRLFSFYLKANDVCFSCVSCLSLHYAFETVKLIIIHVNFFQPGTACQPTRALFPFGLHACRTEMSTQTEQGPACHRVGAINTAVLSGWRPRIFIGARLVRDYSILADPVLARSPHIILLPDNCLAQRHSFRP
jgi:hypothetical protein